MRAEQLKKYDSHLAAEDISFEIIRGHIVIPASLCTFLWFVTSHRIIAINYFCVFAFRYSAGLIPSALWKLWEK